MEGLEKLDGYVNQQTSQAAKEQLKKDVKAFEKEFASHVQSAFQSYDDLIATGEQLVASGQKGVAVRAFYVAALKTSEVSDLEKLERATSKIKEIDPSMNSLDLQQKTTLKAQVTIILMHYVKTGEERYFAKNRIHYTACNERIDLNRLFVGCFKLGSLEISSNSWGHAGVGVGISGVWKF